jgi:hypothetical protein
MFTFVISDPELGLLEIKPLTVGQIENISKE